jgi:biopolymer transport protein ExbD
MGAKVSSSGGGNSKIPEVNAEPNIIPFVDVMLVLLIIFMVAAPIATVDITVSLPETKVLPSKRPPKPTYVSLTDEAGQIRYYVGNNEVTGDTLGEEVKKEVPKNDPKAETLADIIETRIYLRADQDTRYRNIVYVMNRLQDVGFFKIALVGEDTRR